MAQNNVNYAGNPTGPELLDNYLAQEQENILTSNSGIQRPSYAVAGTLWIDTSVTPWLYKIYDGSRDVTIGTVNTSNHTFISANVDETNLVHKTGDETITGAKTFSGSTTLTGAATFNRNANDVRIIDKYTNYTKGTAPTNSQYAGIRINDNTGVEMADFHVGISTGNTLSASIVVKNPGTGVETEAIRLIYPADGTPYVYAPTPSLAISASGYSNQIMTVGYGVTLSTEQTITGQKTFTDYPIFYRNQPYILLSSSSVTKGSNPSSNISSVIAFTGSNQSSASADSLARLWFGLTTDGTTYAQLRAYKNTAGTTTAEAITIYYPTSGDPYTSAPTPTVSDNSTKIATTAYINNKFKKVSTLPVSPNANTFYFITE